MLQKERNFHIRKNRGPLIDKQLTINGALSHRNESGVMPSGKMAIIAIYA